MVQRREVPAVAQGDAHGGRVGAIDGGQPCDALVSRDSSGATVDRETNGGASGQKRLIISQRKVRGEPDDFHSRHRTNLLFASLEEIQLDLVLVVVGPNLRREPALWLETELVVQEPIKTPHQEPRSNHQHEGQGDFRNHQTIHQTTDPGSARRPSRTLRWRQASLRGSKGRGNARHEPAPNRGKQSERQDCSVNAYLIDAWEIVRCKHPDKVHAEVH